MYLQKFTMEHKNDHFEVSQGFLLITDRNRFMIALYLYYIYSLKCLIDFTKVLSKCFTYIVLQEEVNIDW